MSAETLRRAAQVARDEWEGELRGPFARAARVHLAVADWLDDHAETAEMFISKAIPASAWSMNWQTSHNHALAVARAYLGSDA